MLAYGYRINSYILLLLSLSSSGMPWQLEMLQEMIGFFVGSLAIIIHWGGLCFFDFFSSGSCFSASLLFGFSAFLASLFAASLLSLLFCFSCFSASLLSLLLCFSCFSAFLVLCFSASLLFGFSAFLASLFAASLRFCLFACFCAFLLSASLCFPLFTCPASLLFCFSASVPFYFYSTCSFLQSCVSATLLLAPLLLCCLSWLSLCFSFSVALYRKWNPRETLDETQRTLKKSW